MSPPPNPGSVGNEGTVAMPAAKNDWSAVDKPKNAKTKNKPMTSFGGSSPSPPACFSDSLSP